MKFLIVSHVLHKQDGTQIGGYAPFVREMNLWLKHVDEVCVIAPIVIEPFEQIDLSYKHPHINFISVPQFNLTSSLDILKAVFVLPLVLLRLFQGMLWTDHIHLRCPGNMGLLGCFVQMFFPFKQKTAKYAGNWDWESRQPWSYRLQQRLLSSTFLTKNMKALVYGEWPKQTGNVKPFFTATYSETEIEPLPNRSFDDEIKFVFVGGLTVGKQPLLAASTVKSLIELGIDAKLEFLGDGAEKNKLEGYIAEHQLERNIYLSGNVDRETVKAKLIEAHFLIFLSKSEGWPKAVAESMFWGCVPITSRVSCVPYMLGEGERGALIDTNLDEAVKAVNMYIENPQLFLRCSQNAAKWSRQFTLEKLENEIKKLL